MMINKENKEWAPVPRFLNVPRLVDDINKRSQTRPAARNFLLHDGRDGAA